MQPEKVIRNGMVAVLISPDFGAGWSTWASGEAAQMCLFDRRFVEAREAGVVDVGPLAKEIFGDEYVYCGGWSGVEIQWLPVGTAFTVTEYDGSEALRLIEDLTYVA